MRNEEIGFGDWEEWSLLGVSCLLQALCEGCRKMQQCTGEGPQVKEQGQFRLMIKELSGVVLQNYAGEPDWMIKAQALISVMDAYEINGSEKDLQAALAYAEKLLPMLADCPLKCKLLSYCYYYVEEPECADEARRILESWDDSCYDREMQEAVNCYRELV